MVGRELFATAVAISLAAFAAALPTQNVELQKRQNIDNTVLQFALTLEHLENVFYEGVLKNFTVHDFTKAGYSANYYNDLKYIAYDEQQHVIALTSTLKANGQTPVEACTYSFPYTDVQSFITLSSVLEAVGTSAYLGGAPLISSKQYLTVAGSILAVEALHTSLQRTAIGEVPNANPFFPPLDPTSVFTLASMFIVSCPASNPPLPFVPFKSLVLDGDTCTCEEPYCRKPSQYIKRDESGHHGWWPKGGNNAPHCSPAVAGDCVTFTAQDNIDAGSYVTFISGLTVTSVQGTIKDKDITVEIPAGTMGQSYAFVTSSDVETTFDSSKVLFGPAILEVKPAEPVIDFNLQK